MPCRCTEAHGNNAHQCMLCGVVLCCTCPCPACASSVRFNAPYSMLHIAIARAVGRNVDFICVIRSARPAKDTHRRQANKAHPHTNILLSTTNYAFVYCLCVGFVLLDEVGVCDSIWLLWFIGASAPLLGAAPHRTAPHKCWNQLRSIYCDRAALRQIVIK